MVEYEIRHIEPYTYLKDVLTLLPAQRASEIGQLLPHQLRPVSWQTVCPYRIVSVDFLGFMRQIHAMNSYSFRCASSIIIAFT